TLTQSTFTVARNYPVYIDPGALYNTISGSLLTAGGSTGLVVVGNFSTVLQSTVTSAYQALEVYLSSASLISGSYFASSAYSDLDGTVYTTVSQSTITNVSSTYAFYSENGSYNVLNGIFVF